MHCRQKDIQTFEGLFVFFYYSYLAFMNKPSHFLFKANRTTSSPFCPSVDSARSLCRDFSG